ncbi:MAG TPA: regulatory iron-sulfur-containing complex subunit RicT [Candidatus Acidoferrum sp.]|nr:regulatory iron-sulfur-containing complex subunit RicT [Candidatus Acidoferrum sp.]
MARVVRVEFSGPGRHQYSPAPSYPVCNGDAVVVETDWGVGMGHVGSILDGLPLDALKPPVRRILRKATPIDLSRRTALAQRERDVRTFCRERIQARDLPMKLTEVRIGLDSSKAMFYFTANGRVDFRELVKDLTQHLRTRVELRQIGVRDEARVLGSAGPCGRCLCCRSFLQLFAPVGIRMAKDQNLALNPGKLSGICGRLKCCLAYEHPLYADLKRTLPKVGSRVDTCQGPGLIRIQNILKQSVLVGLETGGQITLKPSEITVLPRSTPAARRQRSGQSEPEVTGGEPGGPTRPGSDGQESSQQTENDSPDISALEDP